MPEERLMRRALVFGVIMAMAISAYLMWGCDRDSGGGIKNN
jgi:hypothetical protein